MEWDWAPNSTTSEWDTFPQISFWIFWNLLQKYLRTFVSHFATRRLRASVIGFSSKDFFQKNYSGAPGGPNLVIFGIMVHDPLYFEVGIFSGPTDSPVYV